MADFSSLIAHAAPSEWKKRILSRLQYFRDNDLLPYYISKQEEWSSYVNFASCFSCDQLVYTGQMIKNTGNNYKWKDIGLPTVLLWCKL